MAALTTRAEAALKHDAATSQTTTLLRTHPTVVARCAGPRSAINALASATASAAEGWAFDLVSAHSLELEGEYWIVPGSEQVPRSAPRGCGSDMST